MRVLRNVVVVGASAAGLAAADGLRANGYDGAITILSAESFAPYDRPALSKGLLEAEEDLPLGALRAESHYAAYDLDLRLGQAAVGLDIDRRYVITSDGEPLPYDAVVIASGARARRMRTPQGDILPVLRTAADLAALRLAARVFDDIAVIGLGFIGLEIAAALQPRGVQVSVFGRSGLPLSRVLGAEVAQAVHHAHADHGVAMYTNSEVVEVSGQPGSYTIRTADGQTYRAAHVVAGVGIEPNTDWLARSGVAVDHGVLCDPDGRSSVPDVFAAGDVARWRNSGPHAHGGHWMDAIGAGRLVAHNLLREEHKPFAAVPYFWTTQYSRKYCCYGRWRPGDETIVVDGDLNGDFLALFTDGATLHGVAACGRERLLAGYRELLQRNAGITEALEVAGLTETSAAPSTD
ncbi:NAD(P)/FAD-dependent oxidoreductase [Mycobacterium deserti]|uniref:FAD-dependent oxidoreductase n=1 Tax=Mycobacterium deserti TaxID=2978347 RepID=A0ABT2MEH2_9MYCO|nr:FAD-dependent oxidoreductase [Mycobacterium deserti]MCT7660663.1 FAD-dependent oxidoreductase [Mycobacterium deserti]